MKIKNDIFWILFIVDIIFIIISQILLFSGEYDYLKDRNFVGEFNTLASKTNFTDGQKEKIIKELTNKMEWNEPRENNDGLIIVYHLMLGIPLISHIIFFAALIVCRNYKNIISLICFFVTSLISLIFLIIFSFILTKGVIKPINLTEKDYATNNIEFNKLIKDKINGLKWRTFEFIMSSILLSASLIIIIIVLVIIFQINKRNDNNISNIDSPLVNKI